MTTPFPAEAAGKVQQAIRQNAIADRIKDALTDWQRENLALSMRYRKADEFNQLMAEHTIGKLLGELFQTDAPDFAENAAHDLRVYHDYDPDEDMAWSDVPVPMSVVRSTAGLAA